MIPIIIMCMQMAGCTEFIRMLQVPCKKQMHRQVLNRAQQYVWERGNTKTKVTLNVDEIPDWFKSAKTDVSYLEEQLGDGGTVMNLTGCTLEEVLYQVSAQRPVIVSLGDAGNRQHLIWESMTVLQHLRQQAMYLSVTLKRRLNKKMRKIGAKYFAPIFLQQNGIKKTL